MEGKIIWPKEPMDDICKDLIVSLLKPEPKERLGSERIEDLMRHKFFDGIDFGSDLKDLRIKE